jgi:hypothetical protein
MLRMLVRILDWTVLAAWAAGIVWAIVDQATAPGLVVVVCGMYVFVRFVVPLLIGRGQRPGEVARPYGRPIAEMTCGGRIGLIRFQGPFINVAVYDDRFVFRVLWREYTVMGYDIDVIEDGYQRGIVKITHSAEDTRSPIQLYVNYRVRNAIERIPRTAYPDSGEGIWWET